MTLSVPPSSLARTEDCLAAIERWDPSVKAMITVAAEAAPAEARRLDAETSVPGLLHGMPIAIKDNIETAGIRTTHGSAFFADHIPNRDAPVVERLRRAGAVIAGKTTLHEFAFGVRCHNSVIGQSRNPWNLDRIPGGSSGGSGIAVATGMAEAALGTDTGGSVRVPAALNGITGLRPTFGRVPNHGAMPLSPTLDTIGPMARTAYDAALLFAVIAGHDPRDPLSEDRPLENFLPRLRDGIAGARIGLPRQHYFQDVDPEIEAAVLEAARIFETLGAKLVEVDLPGAEETHRWTTVIINCDACQIHRDRMEGAEQSWSAQTLERLRLGLGYTGLDYAEALRAREAWRRTAEGVFAAVDFILSPTVPVTAPPIDDGRSLFETTRAVTRNTYAGAFGGYPGLSLPCGFSSEGLPIGVQLEAAWWREPHLLRAGVAYQQATDWHLRRPERTSF